MNLETIKANGHLNTYDLSTTQGCIDQMAYGFSVTQVGYGIADEALVAYLQIDGNTVATLHGDLAAQGCEIAKQTLANRQSKLRKKGLLPAAETNAGRPAVKEAEAITEPVIDVEPVEPQEDLDPVLVEEINTAVEELYKESIQQVKDLQAALDKAQAELAETEEAALEIAAENLELKEALARLQAEMALVKA